MSATSDILASLQIAPALPDVVTGIEAKVIYTDAALANDLPNNRQDIWQDIVNDLVTLLRAGFLSRPHSSQASIRGECRLENSKTLSIRVQGPGLHVALVTAMIRMIHATHHTPEGSYEELLAALDFDEVAAKEAFGGMVYSQDVDALTVSVSPQPGSPQRPFDLQQGHLAGLTTPGSGPLSPNPVIQAHRLIFDGVAILDLDVDLEDAFLGLSGTMAFVPLDADPEFEPGDEELFIPEPGTLMVDDISIEQGMLFEFLACLQQGSLKDVKGRVK